MFRCHLDKVLLISRIAGIQYLFKYVCKRSNSVIVKMVRSKEQYSESCPIPDARHISELGALLRLFQSKTLTENQQSAVSTYQLNIIIQDIIAKRDRIKLRIVQGPAKITEWFALIRKWPRTSHIVYADFRCYIIWNKGTNCWKLIANFQLNQSKLAADLTEEERQED